MLGLDFEKFDKKQINIFIINSAEFNKDKKYELFFYRNNDMLDELKDKIRLTLNNKSN